MIKTKTFIFCALPKVLFIVILLLPAIVDGQKVENLKLKGKVVNTKTNQSIEGAAIVLVSTSKGTFTDENGFFSLDLPADTATLIVSSVGYKTATEKVSRSSDLLSYIVKLEENIQELDVVTVVAEKDRIARISVDKISSVKMSPKMVAKLPNMGEVDVIRAFQLLPGVSATNETSAGLYVRGGTPDQNLILFDGMTIYYVDHFYGFFSAFNANTIDDIELLKGGFPAKYGGRISSIMEITGKPADMQRMNGTANLSLLSFSGAIEVPIIKNKLSLQFAIRRSYTDIIRTSLYKKIFDLYNNSSSDESSQQQSFRGGMGNFSQQSTQPSFFFYDLNSKLSYKISNKHFLSFSLYNGKDNLDNSSSSSMPSFTGPGSTDTTSNTTMTKSMDLASWGNTGISTHWNADWNSSFNTSLQLSYSEYFSDRNQNNSQSNSESGSSSGNLSSTQSTLENNNVKDYSARFRNKLIINPDNIIEFGLENTINKITYSLVYNDTVTMVNTKNFGYQTAAYLQDKISLFDKKMEINAGFRGTYQNLTKKFYYEPRLSLSYKLIKGLKFKTAWGRYYQFCTRIIREDVLQGSKDFWLLSDGKTIPVSSAIHYVAGTSYETGNFQFDIEGFYKDLNGLTEYTFRTTNTFRRDQDATTQDYFYKGTGYAKGIEFMVQKKYGLNTGWIAYTLSEVKNTFHDLNYGKPYFALQDQTHEIKAVYCRKIKNWDLSATFVYATGKPYTAPESRYQITLLDGSTYTYWHVSDKNAIRLPDYHKLDLAVTYNLIGRLTDEAFTLSVFNVYNHTNIWYKKYQISENDITVMDIKYLGFTPNISFAIKFK